MEGGRNFFLFLGLPAKRASPGLFAAKLQKGKKRLGIDRKFSDVLYNGWGERAVFSLSVSSPVFIHELLHNIFLMLQYKSIVKHYSNNVLRNISSLLADVPQFNEMTKVSMQVTVHCIRILYYDNIVETRSVQDGNTANHNIMS